MKSDVDPANFRSQPMDSFYPWLSLRRLDLNRLGDAAQSVTQLVLTHGMS
ncbi:hypothetical protein [Schlesneria paludicola]|nr:hypothetical protein [Schlesneria paludicola]